MYPALVSIAVFLLIWKAAAVLTGASIILPHPEETFLQAGRLILSGRFWPAVGATIVRGITAFLLSLSAGLVAGIVAGTRPGAAAFLHPPVTIVRATPVIAVILIALFWFRSDAVPVFVAFLSVFPIIYGNVTEGIRAVEPGWIEMAQVYRVSRRRVLLSVYLPAIFPYLLAGAATGLGLTWKVVVAAEVISQPLRAMGTGMQEAKAQLEISTVFAWTFVTILLSALSERLLLRAAGAIPWKGEAAREGTAAG